MILVDGAQRRSFSLCPSGVTIVTVLLFVVVWVHDAGGTFGGLNERCLKDGLRDILGVLGRLRIQLEKVLSPHRGSDTRLVDRILLLVGCGECTAKEHCLALAGPLSVRCDCLASQATERPRHPGLRNSVEDGDFPSLSCRPWLPCTGDAVGPGWWFGLLMSLASDGVHGG